MCIKTHAKTWKGGVAAFGVCLLLGGAVLPVRSATISYDAADRITGMTYADGTRVTYAYDEAGNLLAVRVDASAPPAVRVAEGISAQVGQPIADHQIEVDHPAAVTRYVITGLPPGLQANRGRAANAQGKAPGMIYGTPTREGVYQVRVAARGMGGLGQAAVLAIHVMNAFAPGIETIGLAGNYSAALPPGAVSGAETGGLVNLRVSNDGSFTARLRLGGSSHAVRGQFDPVTGVAGPLIIQRRFPLGPLEVTLTLQTQGENRGQFAVEISDGTQSVEADGIRHSWPREWEIENFVRGNRQPYNVVLELDPAALGNPAIPQGNGFIVVQVRPNGIARLQGLLADGTQILLSTHLGSPGVAPVHLSLYRNQGYLNGMVEFYSGPEPADLTDNFVLGELSWSRPPGARGGDYPDGFATVLEAVGAAYFPPQRGYRVLDLGDGDIHIPVTINFHEEAAPPLLTSGNVIIAKNNAASVTPQNPNDLIRLNFNATRGTFQGRLRRSEPPPQRAAAFQGILLPAMDSEPARGFGFFLMPGPAPNDSAQSGQTTVGP